MQTKAEEDAGERKKSDDKHNQNHFISDEKESKIVVGKVNGSTSMVRDRTIDQADTTTSPPTTSDQADTTTSPPTTSNRGDQKGSQVTSSGTHSKAHVCLTCLKECHTADDLTLHVVEHLEEFPFPCQICQQCFREAGLLEKHMESHPKDQVHSCQRCFKQFPRASQLKKHLRTHYNYDKHIKPRKWPPPACRCAICGKKCQDLKKLIKHARKHTGLKPHICYSCQRMFLTAVELQVHNATTHEPPPSTESIRQIPSYSSAYTGSSRQCPICLKTFKCSYYCRHHMRSHTAAANRCPVCQKTYLSPNYLKKHVCIPVYGGLVSSLVANSHSQIPHNEVMKKSPVSDAEAQIFLPQNGSPVTQPRSQMLLPDDSPVENSLSQMSLSKGYTMNYSPVNHPQNRLILPKGDAITGYSVNGPQLVYQSIPVFDATTAHLNIASMMKTSIFADMSPVKGTVPDQVMSVNIEGAADAKNLPNSTELSEPAPGGFSILKAIRSQVNLETLSQEQQTSDCGDDAHYDKNEQNENQQNSGNEQSDEQEQDYKIVLNESFSENEQNSETEKNDKNEVKKKETKKENDKDDLKKPDEVESLQITGVFSRSNFPVTNGTLPNIVPPSQHTGAQLTTNIDTRAQLTSNPSSIAQTMIPPNIVAQIQGIAPSGIVSPMTQLMMPHTVAQMNHGMVVVNGTVAHLPHRASDIPRSMAGLVYSSTENQLNGGYHESAEYQHQQGAYDDDKLPGFNELLDKFALEYEGKKKKVPTATLR